MALDFLRRDCAVINDYFRKQNVYVLTTLKLFNFITDLNLQDADSALSDCMIEAQKGYSTEMLQQDKVFEQIYIPRSLQELSHIEIDR